MQREMLISPPPHLPGVIHHTVVFTPPISPPSWACTFVSARSGHGHFSAYHERFGHEETDAECVCGQRRAQLHPFSCPKAREHRLHLWCKKRQRQLSPEEVLGTPEGVAVFAKWAPATGLFHRRYSGLDVFGEGEDDGVQEKGVTK